MARFLTLAITLATICGTILGAPITTEEAFEKSIVSNNEQVYSLLFLA